MVSKINNITNIPSIETIGTKVRYNESGINLIVDRYLEEVRADRKSPVSGAEINTFFELMQNVIHSKQAYEGVMEDDMILVVEEDPPETVDTEAITFILTKRIPGGYSQGPAGKSAIREVTPHVRSIIDHPEAPSQKLITAGRFYDNWVTFNIYARTNKVARERLLWFERTMDIYNWYFRLYGFRVIEDQTEDRVRKEIDTLKITKYPITYIVRTDDTFQYSSQELKKVIFNIEVSQT